MINASCENRRSQRALESRLGDIVRGDNLLMAVLKTARAMALPDWWLVSGCVYQTVWNRLCNMPSGTGIRDYDLIYFDHDLSYAAEDRIIRQAGHRFADLPVQVRNQARVHLWFKDRFGVDYPRLENALQSLQHYASKTHAVAVRLEFDDNLTIAAPFGLDDVFSMTIRPNRVIDNRSTYERKAARMRTIWPDLTVIGGNDDSADRTGSA